MGYKLLYLFWAVLPASLLLLALWARVKRVAKVHGREDAGEYFMQAVFCLIVLIVTIWFDGNLFDSWIGSTVEAFVDPSIPRFLLYPLFLLIAAQISGLVKRPAPAKKNTPRR